MRASLMQRRQLCQFLFRECAFNHSPLKVAATPKPGGVVLPVDALLPEHLLHLSGVFLMQLCVAVQRLRRHLDTVPGGIQLTPD
jgi:hypothetical protein